MHLSYSKFVAMSISGIHSHPGTGTLKNIQITSTTLMVLHKIASAFFYYLASEPR